MNNQTERWYNGMSTHTEPRIDIGIEEGARKAIAEGVARVLADSYTLYLQAHNFHWNVTGPLFRELHLMFEEQYTELATAVDDIAERIRTLGSPAPGTYAEFTRLSSFSLPDGIPEGREMIRLMKEGHEAVVRSARATLPLAQEAGDESTASLLADRMVLHEKTAWMLRSMLE